MRVILTTAAVLTALLLSKAGLGSFDEQAARQISVTNPNHCGRTCLMINGKQTTVQGLKHAPSTIILKYKTDVRGGTAIMRKLHQR